MSPLKRFFYRAPIVLYRLNLGRLLGRRFLRLQHIGRTTGLRRETVLEVVETTPEGNPVVVSGFGAGSQWCRNIMADPGVTVTWGRRSFGARAERLDRDAALTVFERYRDAHPRAARLLGSQIGVSLIDDLDQAAASLPVFTLCPVVD